MAPFPAAHAGSQTAPDFKSGPASLEHGCLRGAARAKRLLPRKCSGARSGPSGGVLPSDLVSSHCCAELRLQGQILRGLHLHSGGPVVVRPWQALSS